MESDDLRWELSLSISPLTFIPFTDSPFHTTTLCMPLAWLFVRPTRWDCVLDVTEQFIHSFFDQNPISHLALAMMRDGKTDALSSLSGNKSKHVRYPHGRQRGALSVA